MTGDKEIFKLIEKLTNSGAKFEYFEECKTILVDYNHLRQTTENWELVYNISREVAKQYPNYYVVVYFYDNYLIETGMSYDGFYNQHLMEKEYDNVASTVNECEAMIEYIQKEAYFEELITSWETFLPIHYKNLLSKTLYNKYKSTLPDNYLDNMVSEAKVFIMNRKGEEL